MNTEMNLITQKLTLSANGATVTFDEVRPCWNYKDDARRGASKPEGATPCSQRDCASRTRNCWELRTTFKEQPV